MVVWFRSKPTVAVPRELWRVESRRIYKHAALFRARNGAVWSRNGHMLVLGALCKKYCCFESSPPSTDTFTARKPGKLGKRQSIAGASACSRSDSSAALPAHAGQYPWSCNSPRPRPLIAPTHSATGPAVALLNTQSAKEDPEPTHTNWGPMPAPAALKGRIGP